MIRQGEHLTIVEAEPDWNWWNVVNEAGEEGMIPSNHVETLVELDHEYAELAKEVGAAPYVRVPALGGAPEFIDGLANAVRNALGERAGSVAPACGWRCGPEWSKCPCREGAAA